MEPEQKIQDVETSELIEDNKIWYYNIALGLILLVTVAGLIYYFLFNSKIPKFVLDGGTNKEANLLDEVGSNFDSNNFQNGIQLVDSKLAEDPNNLKLLIAKANLLAQQASIEFKEKELGMEAMNYVDQALSINPNSTEALTLKGYIYEIMEDYVNAHKYYDAALNLDPEYVPALDQKGHAFSLQGEKDKAKDLFEKALDLNPAYEKSLANISRIYLSNFEDDKATTVLQKLLQVSSNIRLRSDAYMSLATISESQKKYDQALELYKRANSEDPKSALPYVGIARIEFRKDLIPESFANLSKALENNPNQTSAALQLSLQFMAAKDFTSAKKVLNGMKDMIPKDITLSSADKKVMESSVDILLNIINKTK